MKSRFRIGVQTLITKVSLLLHNLGLCPFKNLNYIDQHKHNFPVDHLTKLHPKETHKRIHLRHERLHTCTWLDIKHEFVKVIDQPWVPLHETTKYLSEAEVLPDFLPHLTGGIEALKTSLFGCNFLTFINEVQQLSDLDTAPVPSPDSHQNSRDNLVLATTHSSNDFMTQISELNQKLNKQGRHPVGRKGIFILWVW